MSLPTPATISLFSIPQSLEELSQDKLTLYSKQDRPCAHLLLHFRNASLEVLKQFPKFIKNLRTSLLLMKHYEKATVNANWVDDFLLFLIIVVSYLFLRNLCALFLLSELFNLKDSIDIIILPF